MSELHPSQLLQYLQIHQRCKIASWGCLTVSALLLFASAEGKRNIKPWTLAAATVVLTVGRQQQETIRQLKDAVGSIEQVSQANFTAWFRNQTQPTAQLAVSVPMFDNTWTPENIVKDPVEYIQKTQKHVALVGGTGDGKSTFTQYLSSKIGGRVVVYDSDAKPDDWGWINQSDVIGRKGNFKAIDTAMSNDLKTLEELVELRGDGGDNAIAGRERFLIAEEFPILADECEFAPTWIKRHAKRGRRYKQFVCALAQNDTAENFGLQGDKDTLYSCFVLVRLGKFARDHARSKLKDSRLEEWLKTGGKKRFMVDDLPCELDLSTWGNAIALPATTSGIPVENQPSPPSALNEYEQFIIDWGQNHQGEILKARNLRQSSRLFQNMQPDEIRILFVAMSDRGLGNLDGDGDRLGWYWE